MAPAAMERKPTSSTEITSTINQRLEEVKEEENQAAPEMIANGRDHDQVVAVDTPKLPHLPDLVIEKIFSFLSAKLAVRSSLVCKQWRQISSLQAPVLDFDDEFDLVNQSDRDYELCRRRTELFIKFLENCLQRYDELRKRENASLDKFRLRAASFGHGLIHATYVTKWLKFAIERNVKELDISLGGRGLDTIYYFYYNPFLQDVSAQIRTKMPEYDPELRRCTELFIEYLENCLEQYKPCQRENASSLNKFRLHVASYAVKQLTKCLDFAVEQNVKELDINLGGEYLDLRRLKAEFLTSLNLEYVKIGTFSSRYCRSLFPSLKTMSLKGVDINGSDALSGLISVCPSIHYVSLTSCRFSNPRPQLQNCSLRSLQVTNCDNVVQLSLLNVPNLEFLTLECDTPDSSPLTIHLCACSKLKDINISYQSLKHLTLYKLCQHSLMKITIDTPKLATFYFRGYSCRPVISIKAPNLLDAAISLYDQDKEEPACIPWPFPTLRDFLASFNCSRSLEIDLLYEDAQALVFPEDLLNTLSPPLPSVKGLTVCTRPSLQTQSIEADLRRFLRWMAPSAKITLH